MIDKNLIEQIEQAIIEGSIVELKIEKGDLVVVERREKRKLIGKKKL